jgi:hypothetical protein
MLVRGQWSQLQAPGLHSLFVQWDKLKQREQEYDKVFNIETTDRAYVDEAEFVGVGPLVLKQEGEPTTYRDAQQGGTKRFQVFTFALGMRSSYELYEDDQYGVIKRIPVALARSAHFAREVNTWAVINLGYTSATNILTSYVTVDGNNLFNTSHTLPGGTAATSIAPAASNYYSAPGTWPNRPPTDVDLSFTALQLAINNFERLPDGVGMPIQIKPRHVIIPPELKWVAREILGSAHKPYTADNEINSILNEELDYFIGHYKTSMSAWELLAEKDEHSLKHITRKTLDEMFSDDFDTYSIKEVVMERYAVGAFHWIGTWGSNGP